MELILRSHQIEHSNRLLNVLRSGESSSVLDLSTMGLGKTYTSTHIVKQLGVKNVLVICPVSMESKWKSMAENYKIENLVAISFASLRGVTGKQPKHGFLIRDVKDSTTRFYDSGEPMKEENFVPSQKFISMVSEGMVMIVDEVHNLKNESDQFRACLVLTEEVYRQKSHAIFLSGTPIDKYDQASRILKLMGLNRDDKPIAHICRAINPSVTEQLVKKHPPNNKHNEDILAYHLFSEIIREKFCSAMPNPIELIDCKNGYYNISNTVTEHLEYYIRELHKAVGSKFETGIDNGNLGGVVKALEGIEQSKIPLFERLVRETLASNPNAKICVGLNFVERTLKSLADKLKDLNPGVIYGETSRQVRDKVINLFQEDNSKLRVIIVNVKSLSTGVDLDDKTGNWPRFIFTSPNYNIMDLHQFSRRFIRVDSKSNPVYRFVYGKCNLTETSILNCLGRKTLIMQGLLKEQVDSGVIYPGEYSNFTE